MKRHIDQINAEKAHAAAMRTSGFTTLTAPYVQLRLDDPNGFGVVVAVRGMGGEQHNYAIAIEPIEADMMGLQEQSSWRELCGDCQQQEQAMEKKRKDATEYLGRMIAMAIMDYVRKQDPQFGYSAKEWREINK